MREVSLLLSAFQDPTQERSVKGWKEEQMFVFRYLRDAIASRIDAFLHHDTVRTGHG